MIRIIGSVDSCGVPCQECGRVLSRSENINIVRIDGEAKRVCDECLEKIVKASESAV